ncbi:Deoxyuridine 5'-triphosphate nucleotidohydrolase [Arachis hypogaea]|nr:Deoxyuridine 5'-triphosphate nucleotidohydrolase [Arachis hypogaea]
MLFYFLFPVSAVEKKIPARGKDLVVTDLNISIPKGTYARIAPRSGLPLKHWIDVGAGVIDASWGDTVQPIDDLRCFSDLQSPISDLRSQKKSVIA